jgi:putative phage-type endonuclease
MPILLKEKKSVLDSIPEQGTEEWLQFRRNHIGASDAPVIMKMSPWKTPYQLWEEKLGIVASPPLSSAMKRGVALEEKARQCFEEMTGIAIRPVVRVHPDHMWMMASLDGLDGAESIVVEIKCPNQEDHAEARNGKIPPKYFPQLQHQLEVIDFDWGFYFSFDGSQGILVEVKRDRVYIEQLLEKEKRFWDQLQALEPPPFEENDFVRRTDKLWEEVAQEWNMLQEQLRRIQLREGAIRNKLIDLAGERNTEGHGIKVSRIIRKGCVDFSKIPELASLDLEKYRKEPKSYWRVSRWPLE